MRINLSSLIGRSRLAAAPFALALITAMPAANAATASGTLSVSASVASVCLISNGSLNFGSYDPTSGSTLNGSTTVTLTCTLGTAYNIGLNAGAGTGATVALRKLTSGGNTLGYRLFRDPSRTLNWGNTPATDTLDGTSSASLLTNTITVYGQIPASEAAPTGSYTDSVAITVTY
ncbi:spore coat U domain-containing protein [Nevskia sp.]|uniref:Csu type fimbrial protein n=1 Tax=Nevskia sp. TaxID=1929292 RepID=UPI0025EE77F4|nr:spore coat U domain-containing protein [Nevskia sp.]